ncbi:MAG: hypothetical protein GF308_21325 [Candidatus Heimdallarchaeota archaeon]|nr:hypothetical protein [Candidatus Heimdallarchaeota archaeon]
MKRLILVGLILSLIVTPLMGISTPQFKRQPPPAFFNVTLIVPDNIPERIQWANMIKTQLELIGIGVTIDYQSLYDIVNMLYSYPGPFPIPTHSGGGYDLVLIGILQTSPTWRPTEMFGSDYIVPNGFNHYQYSSTDFDNTLLLHNTSCYTFIRRPYIEELQEILFEDLPSIPVVYPRYAYPMLNTIHPEDLCLWLNDLQPMDQWTDDNDGTLMYATPGPFQSYHPYFINSYYDRQWLYQIYDSLAYVKNCTRQGYYNRIAVSYKMYGCTHCLVEIDNNAKWADGTNLTADDVIFSYQAMMNPTVGTEYQWINEYLNPNLIQASDPRTVLFNLTKPYHLIENILSLPLIPKHIWQPVSEGGTGPEYANWSAQAETWVKTDPSKIIGCGPFKLHQWNESYGVILEKNPYFDDLIHHSGPNLDYVHLRNYTNKADALNDLALGLTEIVDTNFGITPSDYNSIAGLAPQIVKSTKVQEISVNMIHPYLGTGSACPIPGVDSAKSIRKAICNAIPRQDIINNLLDGLGGIGVAPCPEGCIGFNADILPCGFSIVAAKDHMRAAGFVYPENTATTSPTDTPSPTETSTETSTPTSTVISSGLIGITLTTTMGIFVLVGGCIFVIIKRKRK